MGLPKRLPFPLSQRLSGASAALYSRQGREFDVAIGGIPFMLATSRDVPQTIETIKVRKDQFDIEDPGEQSLTGWWRRSQASFHQGAGLLYLESSTENSDTPGFHDSEGIDPFTIGQIKLIRKMQEAAVSGSNYSRIRSYAVNSVRTNLATNPSPEVDLTGWTGDDVDSINDPTVTRDTSIFHSGTASARVNFVDDAAPAGFPQALIVATQTITPNTTYTASIYVYVPTGSGDVMIVSEGIFGTTTAGLRDQWVRLSVTSTSDAAGVTQILVWPTTPPTSADLFYADDALCEEGAILGPYFDGASADAEWTGVAYASTSLETISFGTASFSAVADGELHTADDATGTYSSLHAPAGKTVVDGLVSGSHFYDIASDGTLYEGLLTSPGTATTWPLGATPSRIAWGKHRLWVVGSRRIWQPDLSLAGGSAQSPIFTNPDQGWTYTCIAEGASAMYFGGHDGFHSSIQAVTFDTGGGLPTLTGASVTAVLPDGELVQELSVLGGQYIGIGTSRGFRVGVINSDASITYGPLLFKPDDVIQCSSLTTQDRFFVVGFLTAEMGAVAYRVDTGTQITDGVFPYAKDINCSSGGSITSMTAPDASLVATTSDGRVWYQSPDTYVNSGWIETGRVRFRTNEPKSYRFLELNAGPLEGSIACLAILEGGGELPIGSFTQQGELQNEALSIAVAPMREIALKFQLVPSSDGTGTPVIYSWLLRALPAVAPQRLITLPLMCFDQEQSRSGQRYGTDGFARDRYTALSLLEDAAEELTYQDFSGVAGDHRVVIESLRFVQTAPPRGVDDAGGILIAELRTVDN